MLSGYSFFFDGSLMMQWLSINIDNLNDFYGLISNYSIKIFLKCYLTDTSNTMKHHMQFCLKVEISIIHPLLIRIIILKTSNLIFLEITITTTK